MRGSRSDGAEGPISGPPRASEIWRLRTCMGTRAWESMTEDFYSRLGVMPDASEEAIRRAYRAKVAEQHPDVSDHPDAEARFRRLNRAKNVLTDQELRRQYDRLGHEAFVNREETDDRSADASPPTSPARPGRTAGTSHQQATRRTTIGSLFDQEFNLSRLGNRIWQAAARPGRQSAGVDSFTVDLTSVLRSGGSPGPRGTDRRRSRDAESSGQSKPDCPACGGRGSFLHVIDTAGGRQRRIEPCEECAGSGTG